MHETRITLMDTPLTAIVKLAEGNPGAVSVLGRVMTEGGKIDPDSKPFLILLNLDTLGLYGPRVWMLYKDVCGERLDRTLAVLRAWQLGLLSRDAVHHAVENRGAGVVPHLEAICKVVKERLPSFTFTEENQATRDGES